MPELEASRTLVKSTPELWAECSDAGSLARHLGAFGEIRITRLEPETAVAWEGDEVRGTVTLEPSGWGTRVVLTAVREGEAKVAGPLPEAELEPTVEPPEAEARLDSAQPPASTVMASLPEPTRLMRILSRLGVRVRWPAPVAATDLLESDPGLEPDLDPELAPEPEPTATVPEAEAEAEAEPEAFPEPAPDPVAVEEPVAEEARIEADEEPEASEPELDALISALNSLGTPRRRPFSRA